MQGGNRKSFGLKVNVLICCIIVFADNASRAADGSVVVAAKSSKIVDDLGGDGPRQPKKKQKLAPLQKIMSLVFGKNASKVEQIFEAWTAYMELFDAVNDPWLEVTTAYKEARAVRLYKSGATSHAHIGA